MAICGGDRIESLYAIAAAYRTGRGEGRRRKEENLVEDAQGPLKFCLTWNHEDLASSLESLSKASFAEGLDDDMSLASKEGDENDILEYIVQKVIFDSELKKDGDVVSVIWEKVMQLGVNGVEKDDIYVEKTRMVEKKAHKRMNWDPKPFKVFSCWYEHPDCVPFVANVWNTSNVQEEAIKDLNSLDQQVTIEGDNVLNDVSVKRGEAHIRLMFESFSPKFLELMVQSPKLHGVAFNRLSKADNNMLEEPFTMEELKDVIWNSNGEKSMRPHGFNMGFYKKCWEIVKDALFGCVSEFYLNSILPKSITTSFITLLPKTSNPQGLNEFLPICLVGSVYRIPVKLL
ncbi:hypothetical protein KIW84_013555 [Lathyrus oleraceus]|uniref:Uncharacterized protein n=1 Tax=Pisum sativum TaxID=3888 RepID=A0A9D5BKD3_PEA|nr:hypothetical protein KIW84_013555 [Pisum sativum]